MSDIAELTSSGATAVLILDAQRRLCGICVENVLKRVDSLVANDGMTPEKALGLVHELAAYRAIIYRQQQEINQARAAANRSAANG